MNISKQKIFLYIPIINFFIIMVSWLLFYYKNNISTIRFLKNVIKIFTFCFLITIPRILIDKFTDILLLENILLWIYIIIYMFIPSFFALKDQEKYVEEQK